MSNPGTTNLIAWWSLDETSGTRNDSHTNGYHLTDNNTVLYGAGKHGNAADFDIASTEYLSRADNADLSGGGVTGDFTFACWVYLESLPGSGGARTFASKWDAGVAAEWGLYQFNSGGTHQMRMVASGDGSTLTILISAGLALSAGAWYFVVGWHDSAADKIYVQVNNGTPAEEAHTTGIYNSDKPFIMGGLLVGGAAFNGSAMDGLIDEASFWKRVLTADERTWLWNSGAGRVYDDLSAPTVYQQAVAGTMTSAGVVVKKAKKPLAGAMTSAGVVVKSAGKVLAGAMASAGVVVKKTAKPLAGVMSSAGAVVKKTGRALAGAMNSAGTLSSVFQGAITALVALTARARSFALTAAARVFDLTARNRN